MDSTSADVLDTRDADERAGGVHLSGWACELAGTALLLLGGLSAVAAPLAAAAV